MTEGVPVSGTFLPRPAQETAQQAAAIPYRYVDGELNICLITTMTAGRWSIPKGFIDPGHTAAGTAQKETREEAGVHGRVLSSPVGYYVITKTGIRYTVAVYLLQVERTDAEWEEQDRRGRDKTPRGATSRRGVSSRPGTDRHITGSPRRKHTMTINKHYLVAFGLTLLALGLTAGAILPATLQAQSSDKVFELRTYTTTEGKLPNLLARFRDHTMQIFQRHGMENVAYWVPKDTPNTLIYIISHLSSQAATENWQRFRSDPEWPGVAEASGVGRVQVESVFMDATDFSPMK